MMHWTRLLSLLMLLTAIGMTLADCGVAPAPQTTESSPAAPVASGGAATAEPAPTAAVPAAAATAAAAMAPTDAGTATSAPHSDTNPAKPDDATQARLRVSYCIAGGAQASVLVNGKVAVNGGMPQDNLVALQASGYLYLAPGTYGIAVVPTGLGIDKAVLGPLDVPVVAGHRYTVVELGQVDEASHTPLVIDETEAYRKAGVSPGNSGHITVNNVKGARGISFIQDGIGEKDVPYGNFAALAYPAGPFKDFKVIYSGSADQAADNNGPGFNLPAVDALDCFDGVYPNSISGFTSVSTSSLNAIDFLQAQSDESPKVGHPEWAYSTLLAAFKITGLTEQLTSGGPYLVFAPTDEAFAAMPKEKLAALLAAPKALADMLRRYIVAGCYPYGSLSRAPVTRGFNRTVTNLRREQLKLSGDEHDLRINDQPMGSLGPIDPLMVANGVRMITTSKLLPAAK